MVKIGVLALQGAVREHVNSIEACGAEAVLVKRAEDLAGIDGLILPGGESTTMRRLLDLYGMMEPLQKMVIRCSGLVQDLFSSQILSLDMSSHI
jgi:5'-phosphate synthase pdxT subunit